MSQRKFLRRVAWTLGSVTVASSIGYGAYLAHKVNTLPTHDAHALNNAQQIAMLNGLGLCLAGTRKTSLIIAPMGLLLGGTVLFSGIIIYSRLYNNRKFNWLVPYGGFCSIIGWLALAIC